MKVIGRIKEIEMLESLYKSESAEFVAVYGRRRVGKTFLIKELFKDRFAFWHTGVSPYDNNKKGLMSDQLREFHYSLMEYGYKNRSVPTNWIDAFHQLQELLESKDRGKRMVVFIDELPWMDTARSKFIPAFEHFWNGWCNKHDNVMLIVCGSATSWIKDNLINNKGGLYDRVTKEIKIQPFTLQECEMLFKSKGIAMSRYDIVNAYMLFSGVPMYLNAFEKGLSVAQNIDNILFSKSATLKFEFDRLFKSLFKNGEQYQNVVRFLATNRSGYTRQDIIDGAKLKNGGDVTDMLKALEASDFVRSYVPYGNSKRVKYKLSDNYCLAYLHFVDRKKVMDEHFWENKNASPELNAWRGIAFEDVCFNHIRQIKKALGVQSVHTTEQPLVILDSKGKREAQIDMVIVRDDNVVNVCEMKFYGKPFAIDKKYEMELRERVVSIAETLKRTQTAHLTFITSFGVSDNEYSSIVQKSVVMDALFE